MSFVTLAAAFIGAFASTAVAHGTTTGIVADGTYFGGYKLDYYYQKVNGGTPPDVVGWSAENLDNGFVDGTGYQSADIICHKNAAPGKISAPVAAGGKIDFQWSVWPESHMGPVLTYIANCNGECATVDKTALQWVKIDAKGLEDGKWAAISLIANNNTWTTTIPSSIAPGNYVLRHEIIALHGAGSENGAQNYPQCINVEVTGAGTDALPSGTLGTALYTNKDAGILFDPYKNSPYEIPGPALYAGAGSGGNGNIPAPPAVTEAAPAPSATPTSAPPASPDPPVPTASTVPTATTPVADATPTSVVLPAPPVVSAIEEITATLPSEVINSPLPTLIPTPTPGAGDSPKPLPAGTTLKDLLDWLSYYLKNILGDEGIARRHVRDLHVL